MNIIQQWKEMNQQNTKRHRGTLNVYCWVKKLVWKGCILFDSSYMAFWKRQNFWWMFAEIYHGEDKTLICIELYRHKNENVCKLKKSFKKSEDPWKECKPLIID